MTPAHSDASRPHATTPDDTGLPTVGLRKDRRGTSTPTFAEVWQILTDDDRAQLAGIDLAQDEILAFLHTQPGDDTQTRMFAELQVERLHVYRTALDRQETR